MHPEYAIMITEVIIMRTKSYIQDPQELLEQGKQLVANNSDIKFAHRVSMVNLVLSGMSPKLLAEYSGDGETTIMSWVTKVDEHGWDALVAKKQPGRPSKLSDAQKEELKLVIASDPLKYGYNVWEGSSLSDYIKNTYDVKLGVRACQKLFHELGFSLVRAQVYPSLENPDKEARDNF